MRKIYIIALLLLSVLVSFSQVKNSNWVNSKNKSTNNSAIIKNQGLQKSTLPEKATVSPDSYVSTSFTSIQNAVKAKKNVAVDALSVIYGRPDGTLFEGFSRDYKSYQGVFLHSPAITTVDYVPYASDNTATFAWNFLGGENAAIEDPMDADGTLHFSAGITPSSYYNYLPKVTVKTTTETADYVIGKGSEFQYMLAALVDRSVTEDGTAFNGVEEFPPLTLGNSNENRPTSGNLYVGFSASASFSPSYSNENGACTGVMQIIPQLKSPLYTESVSVLAYEEGGTAVPEGGVMKIQFYYLTAEGSLGELIGESTTNEFVKTLDTRGVFSFKFQEEEDGFIIDKPITFGTKAPIVVVITGFDATWNFKFLFGVNSIEGSSYTLHGNDLKVSTFGYSNAPDVPLADLYIQFNGIFNCLVPMADELSLTFPEAGGWGITGYNKEDGSAYNDVDLYSSYNVDDDMTNVWIESAPDWVDGLDMDSTKFTDYQAVLLYFHAEALPEGVTGRSGEIVVSSYGVSVKIPVVQGNITGLNNPKATPVKIAKTATSFEISEANYTNVGLVNLAGQSIGNYAIKNNSVSIPTTSITSGIYFLRFQGTSGISHVLKVSK